MNVKEYKKQKENIPINIFLLDQPFYAGWSNYKRAYSGQLYNAPDNYDECEIIYENMNLFTNNQNIYIY